MTRKHFIKIAAAIADTKCIASSTTHAETVRQRLANSIADVCAETNPLFDRSRFLKACAIG